MAQMPDDPETLGFIDRRIGVCIRARREMLGWSVRGLAHRMGRPVSVIEDYEAGRARAGASVLLMLTEVLQVEIGYFLRTLAEEAASPAHVIGFKPWRPIS